MLYMFETIGTINFEMLSRNCKLFIYLVSLFCCNPPNRLSICIGMLVHLVSYMEFLLYENTLYMRTMAIQENINLVA
jgi:hypothetical protein